MLLRHCGLDPQSPEHKEILKQVQDLLEVAFHREHYSGSEVEARFIASLPF